MGYGDRRLVSDGIYAGSPRGGDVTQYASETIAEKRNEPKALELGSDRRYIPLSPPAAM